MLPPGSTLGVFDPSNPFRPPAKIVKAGKRAARRPGLQARPPDQGARTQDRADDGGSTSGGGGSDTPPGSGGGDDAAGQRRRHTTTVYKYVVD